MVLSFLFWRGKKIPNSFVLVNIVFLCFLHLTDLMKSKSRVTRQPWLDKTIPTLFLGSSGMFFLRHLRSDRGGGGRTATLAEATSCHVSARTLQVKPVGGHSITFPHPCWAPLGCVCDFSLTVSSGASALLRLPVVPDYGLLLVFLGPQREAEASTQRQRQAVLLFVQNGVWILGFAQAIAFILPTDHPASNSRTRGAQRRCRAGGLRRTTLHWTLTPLWDARQEQRGAGWRGRQDVPLWGEGRPWWAGPKGDGHFLADDKCQTRRVPGEELHRQDIARPDQEWPAARQTPHTGTRLRNSRTF